jgi:glycosyl transferase family 2
MAFRRSALLEIGGFDHQFRTAGDDVDICWRLRERGWTLGFHPGAVVWHHRRNSVRMYWKQQKGYGRAEALLERKWPEKYNGAGHVNWAGSLYGLGLPRTILSRPARIYQGSWGSALFQSLYQPAPGVLAALPLMPEWYLGILLLAVLSGLGLAWPPLLAALPLLALAVGAVVIQAGLSAARARFNRTGWSRRAMLELYGLTAFLYLVQPIARLWGRLAHGLTPWRHRGASGVVLPRRQTCTLWRERGWTAPEYLQHIRQALREVGAAVNAGGDFDRWDLEVRLGMLGTTRVLMATEEHGAGRQLLRFRVRPHASPGTLAAIVGALALAGGAVASEAWLTAAVIGAAATLVLGRALIDQGRAVSAVEGVIAALEATDLAQDENLAWDAEIQQVA